MWLLVHGGGDCGRLCGECGWWHTVVGIVGGGVLAGGAQWW